MKFIKIILVLLFLSLPLGQFGRLPFLQGSFNFYLQDLAVFILVVSGFSYLIVKGKLRKSLIDTIFFAGLVFVVLALITLIYNSQWLNIDQNLLGFSYWARFLLYFAVYFVLCRLYSVDGKDLKEFLISLTIISGLIIAVAGFIQLALLPDLSVLRLSGYDPHRNRLVSTFLDPNFTGAFLVLTLNLVFSRFTFRSLRQYFFVAVLLIALILTFSRSAWLMFTISIFLFGIFRSRKLLFLSLLVGFLAYFLIPRIQTRVAGITDPDDSAKLRFVSWGRTLTIAKDHLGLGVGFNNFRASQEEYGFFDYNIPEGGRAGGGSDSSLLLVLATTGLIGFFLYTVFYLSIVGASLSAAAKGESLALGLFISMIGLLLESNFINSLFFTPILLWIFVTASLISNRGNTR